MLYGMYIHINSLDDNGDKSGSSSMSYDTAKKLYDNLDGVEQISYNSSSPTPTDAKGTTGKPFTAHVHQTDDGFWRVYDFELIDGRYYDAAEVASGRNVAVISQKTAGRLFGKDSVVGQHFQLGHNDFEVIGVVADVSPLTTMAYGEIFTPISFKSWDEDNIFGEIMASMLIKEGVDFEYVRNQVKGRYATLDSELAADKYVSVYHGAPFDQETIASGVGGSNITPNPDTDRYLRYAIYLILLIVPAINLSSMLHSRLRHRVNEIGIRRAFGCTRKRIIRDIISESLIVTIIGGIIGLAAAIIFAMCYDGLYDTPNVRPALSLLIRPQTFVSAFAACFVLNIISAAVPAWQASRLNPVDAINTK